MAWVHLSALILLGGCWSTSFLSKSGVAAAHTNEVLGAVLMLLRACISRVALESKVHKCVFCLLRAKFLRGGVEQAGNWIL